MRKQTLTSFHIAKQNLTRKPFRAFCLITLVALFSLVLSGGSFLALSLMKGSKSLSDRLGADALLVPHGYEHKVEGALLRGEPNGFYFDGEVAQKLLGTAGVARASPQLFIATLDSSHCAFPVQMIGYDPDSDFVIAPWLMGTIQGGLVNGEVVIGSSIDAMVGDALVFFNTKYKVRGQLERTGMGFDTSVFLNMETAHSALKEYMYYSGAEVPDAEHAVSVITADIDAGYPVAEFARTIRDRFRKEQVGVVLTKTMFGSVAKGLHVFLVIIAILAGIWWLLSIGVLTIMFTVMLHERKRELGIYRALGATRKKLVFIILSESSIISLAGTCIGIILLVLLGFPFVPLIEHTIAMPYLQPSPGMAVAILFLSGSLSFLTGTLASVHAASKIGRLATSAIIKEGA
ncbi:MAG: ABC transporter permease [Treponema sp.]|jgi:putative ABC transport system permease protein|nr:ABC transporter permease [Treponema sp.]